MTRGAITSRSNPLVRELRALLRSPSRASRRCVVEGWRLLEAAADAAVPLHLAVLTPEAAGDPRRVSLRDRLRSAGVREVLVAPQVLAALTQVESPQGVLAIAARPVPAPEAVLRDPRALLVLLDGVQDPGNVGTILRTAAAAGATAAVTIGPAADPLGPKALRASAGAAFRLPLRHFRAAPEAAAALEAAGVRVLVADPRGERAAARVSFVRPIALVFGSEGAGPAPVWERPGVERVRVPIAGPVESLNVAAAAAILLYRAAGLDA